MFGLWKGECQTGRYKRCSSAAFIKSMRSVNFEPPTYPTKFKCYRNQARDMFICVTKSGLVSQISDKQLQTGQSFEEIFKAIRNIADAGDTS